MQDRYGEHLTRIDAAPDVYRLLTHRRVAPIVRHVQQAIWTSNRIGRSLCRTFRVDPDQRTAKANTFEGLPSDRPPTTWLDMTSTYRGSTGGGIKRVCEKISQQGDIEANVRTVIHAGEEIHDIVGKVIDKTRPISIGPSDTYVILDAFWEPFDLYLAALRKAKAAGAKTGICIHDVIPLVHPDLLEDVYVRDFRQALIQMMPHVDFVLTVSKESAGQIETALRELSLERDVIYFKLGADLVETAANITTRGDAALPPTFTSLGTLEPKKGYECTLDAFELLWAKDIDVRFQIIGRPGWLCDALIERIRRHPDFGTRLIWLDDASDAEVREALQSSYCYIQASLAEGFGLPVIEAARHGLPIIASDIAVFREIAGDAIVYFPVCDAVALSGSIEAALANRPASVVLNCLTWAESKASLATAINARAATTPKLQATEADGTSI